MFIGRYYHRLESKGRLSLPKAFRHQQPNWVLTRGFEGCLFLLPFKEFEKNLSLIAAQTFTNKNQRELTRLLTNDAKEVKPDSLGRISVPDYLITQAGLDKQVVIVGSFQYIEIWDQVKYHQHLDTLSPDAEKIAEQIVVENKN